MMTTLLAGARAREPARDQIVDLQPHQPRGPERDAGRGRPTTLAHALQRLRIEVKGGCTTGSR